MNRRFRMLALVACALMLLQILRPIPAAAAVEALPDDYQYAIGFAETKNTNEWSYLQWDGTAYSEMDWKPLEHRWRGSCEFCIIARGGMHPDVNDAVIGWTAPRAGTVTVRGTIDSRDYGDPARQDIDGVRAFVRQRSGSTLTKVWPSEPYQEIRPGFMAQHIFQTTVAAGDQLLFHVNKNGTTYNDSTSWFPRISYGHPPKFTLDQAELVMGPDDFEHIGINDALDGSVSVVPKNGSFDFYHSSGNRLQKFHGDLRHPAQTPVYHDPASVRFTNLNQFDGTWWIENIYRTPEGHLLAFCHIENANPATSGWWAGGLAYSTDDGEHFQILGKTIAAEVKQQTGANGNIGGMPFVVKDGYFYVYFTEPGVPSVARAPVDEVLDAARRGTVSQWMKIDRNGGFTSDGMNGTGGWVVQAGETNDYSTHGDAAYSTYLGKYLMAGGSGGAGRGVFLAFGDDPAHFETPNWLLNSDAVNKPTLSPYETIVNLDGSDNGEVGREFYVYFGYYFVWPRDEPTTDISKEFRWLYRQKVTLNAAGFDRSTVSLGTDYTGKHGENGLDYVQRFNGPGMRYFKMDWSDQDLRWHGAEQFALVDSVGMHPGNSYDVARAWRAPRTGTVRVSASGGGISTANGSGADGVRIAINRETSSLRSPVVTVWPAWDSPAIVAPGTTLPFAPVDIPVTKGEWLYFNVNKNGNNGYDTTVWVPQIAYLP
ncbi:hypothetical protein AB0J72_52005 [Dactylosporangium sp. NPDC049742]|uniref:hypothetical protein n=1 Tax=Dactylosporangium sp. NPDC049742 TaxID=3154737 RepID=UPI0034162742